MEEEEAVTWRGGMGELVAVAVAVAIVARCVDGMTRGDVKDVFNWEMMKVIEAMSRKE